MPHSGAKVNVKHEPLNRRASRRENEEEGERVGRKGRVIKIKGQAKAANWISLRKIGNLLLISKKKEGEEKRKIKICVPEKNEKREREESWR